VTHPLWNSDCWTTSNFTCDYCTVLIDIRFCPSKTFESVLADVRGTLDAIKREDLEFQYEIEAPPPARYNALRVNIEPTDVPLDADIVRTVSRHYTSVTGAGPRVVGPILPLSYGGDDICHLGRAGMPCVLYGPEGLEGTGTEPDTCAFVSEMVLAAKVLALTALDVCNRPVAGGAGRPD
jgi:acetylornithine deacetylase